MVIEHLVDKWAYLNHDALDQLSKAFEEENGCQPAFLLMSNATTPNTILAPSREQVEEALDLLENEPGFDRSKIEADLEAHRQSYDNSTPVLCHFSLPNQPTYFKSYTLEKLLVLKLVHNHESKSANRPDSKSQ